MKTDNATIQAIADEISEHLGAIEATHKLQGKLIRGLHKRLERAGKMLSDETEGGVVIQATGEGK